MRRITAYTGTWAALVKVKATRRSYLMTAGQRVVAQILRSECVEPLPFLSASAQVRHRALDGSALPAETDQRPAEAGDGKKKEPHLVLFVSKNSLAHSEWEGLGEQCHWYR
jgi:hypothetical protein